jgi:phosphatidylglycerol:prolipoprotein diacylglycerol transferase
MLLGIFTGSFLLFKIIKNEKLSLELMAEMLLFSMFGGILGARILYVALYANQFANLKEVLAFWNGGMVSFGGMIGGLLAAFIFLKFKNQNVLKWFDLAIVPLFVGWAVGRIGCFLNGDSTGLPTPSILGIWGVFPTALYESIWLIICSLVIYLIHRSKRFNWSSGAIFSLAFVFYGLGRFFIDFVQAEPVWFWGFRYGQIGALATLVFALVLFWISVRKQPS